MSGPAPLPPDASFFEKIAAAPAPLRKRLLDRLLRGEDIGFDERWEHWARKSQLPPEGDAWRIWLLMAGRGFGKTRAGAEWVRGLAERDGDLRIALVAATMAEGRGVMIEGQSGLLSIAPPHLRPRFEPSLRRLVWPGGAQAFLYSAAEPEALRGPEHHFAWADEIAKWPHGIEAWDNLAMGLRLGRNPRTVATTTPRPVPLVRRLIGEAGVVTRRGATADNVAHLPGAYVEAMHELYGGTRIGRQELDGELIEEIEGALWSRALIERCRVRAAPKARRVVLGVDPPAGAGAASDACGIVAVAPMISSAPIAAIFTAGPSPTPGSRIGRNAKPETAEKARNPHLAMSQKDTEIC